MTKTEQQTLDELRKQPGIDVSRAEEGMKIIVETTQAVYEMVVLDPLNRVLRITGTDRRCSTPVTGQLLYSAYDLEEKLTIDGWIGKSMRMCIRFANGNMKCSCSVSARVEGDDWHYEVF